MILCLSVCLSVSLYLCLYYPSQHSKRVRSGRPKILRISACLSFTGKYVSDRTADSTIALGDSTYGNTVRAMQFSEENCHVMSYHVRSCNVISCDVMRSDLGRESISHPLPSRLVYDVLSCCANQSGPILSLCTTE
jgi:hypothetical protein